MRSAAALCCENGFMLRKTLKEKYYIVSFNQANKHANANTNKQTNKRDLTKKIPLGVNLLVQTSKLYFSDKGYRGGDAHPKKAAAVPVLSFCFIFGLNC